MGKLQIGVVGIPGKWSTEVLADAVERSTGFRLVIDMAKVSLDLTDLSLHYQGINLCDLDAILVKKIHSEYSPHTLDRLEMLRIAEAKGVQVMSPAVNILRLIDRLSCTVTLREHNIPMPDTVVTEDIGHALAAVKRFGSAVLKPLYSTKARGMTLLDGSHPDGQLVTQLKAFAVNNPVLYIQKKLDLPGKDLGMVFLGGQYIGAYARVTQNDAWNTTIHSGGKYGAFDAPQSLVDLAYRAQQPFNMDFTTVDVAESESGPIVFEVSAFGGFRGCKEGLGIDAADLYAQYALKKFKGVN